VPADKDPGALLTIGELSGQLGVAQHILRYWESRFPQLRPMQRAGNRRYYRAADVELVQRINRLLNQEGYTVRGVQKLLREKENAGDDAHSDFAAAVSTAQQASAGMLHREEPIGVDVFRLIALRNRLSDALDS
jgi:DNA-binding transcriptional MerR regulator